MKKTILFLVLLMGGILIFQSCATYNRIKNLDPQSREFLQTVKYIITPKEKDILLNLPPDERAAFVDEFWVKRDPDPDTEINEFKQEYFGRIEAANLLFKQGSTPGWLQERGRVYITLGPPDHREQFPRGQTMYGFPTEIWYYGWFPIIFVDENWTGNFRLDPISAQHINEINRAQVDLRPTVALDQIIFDYKVDVKKTGKNGVRFQIKIPYRNIWMEEGEENLETQLDVLMIVNLRDGGEVWKNQQIFTVSLPKDELVNFLGQDYILEFSARMQPGKYTLMVEIQNLTGEKRVRKNVNFSMK